MADASLSRYAWGMEDNEFYQIENQKPATPFRTDVPSEIDQRPVDFMPPENEVSHRAYFNYLNEGSPRGRDVQHWLNAEAELIAEHHPIKLHGFCN
jgi:hypothetical protein